MKKKTEYLDVSQGRSAPGHERWGGGGGSGGSGGGLPGSGEGGGRPLDPVSQQYMLGVWEKIKNAWGLPGMSKYSKNLETVVTIRIRKDGRIVDINIEKRSGNRVYDESILRVLRSVDPLPPIPSSLNTDSLEIGFRFLPGELS
jgi:colicin import membrane protein